ncbi:MAG: O-antigen ligase family protein [Ktedonobacteraceae bacterium]
MQVSGTSLNGGFPSRGGGNSSDIAAQLQSLRESQKRILLRRGIGFWWYRILLVILAGLLAGAFEPYVLQIWHFAVVAVVALIVLFWLFRHVEFGLFLIAMVATPFFQIAIPVKSLNLYPSVLLIPLLFAVVMVQVAFRVRKPIYPSFQVIWPLLGLIFMAVISNIMGQVMWTPMVPHKVGSSPVIYDELLGIAMFCIPLIIIITTCAVVTKKEQWIEYIQRGIMILGLLGAAIVTIEFRRIGGDIYTFRYAEPKILWMSLRALATLLALASMITYARCLYATTGRMRLMYGAMTVWCLLSVYFTLENSWWLEVGAGLLVITFIYSRRFFLYCCLLVFAATPLIIRELNKLSQVKSVDSLRFVIWQDALRVWSKQPMLGVGPGNFWTYDQRFTHLPILQANFNKTGLGVAHNGYLQTLGELGPIGLFLQLALIFLLILTCFRLFNRSHKSLTKKTPTTSSETFQARLGINLFQNSEQRKDAALGLAALGLICGSVVADFTSGFFFLPPRQLGGFNDLPQVVTAWILWGCVVYKDQIWRKVSSGEKLDEYY